MKVSAFRPVPSIKRFRADTTFAWPLVRMGDVVTLHYGKALTEGSRRPGDIPVYGSNGRTGWHDIALSNGPTVILGRKGMGNLGVEWCEGPFWVIDTAYYTSFRQDVLPRFFYYFADYVGLNHLKDGTSNPSLTRDTFSRQWFPLPPLDVQRSIANMLADLDDKIELNKKMIDLLEAMAHAIFKSWFVDFDPVCSKAEGCQPPGMDADTAGLFPNSFEESSLGKIPKGWRVGKVAELASLSRESVNPSAFSDEVFDHYSIPAFDEGRWPKQETGAQIKSNKFLVPPNSVLVSKLNPRFPRAWLPATNDGLRSIASTEFLVALARQPFSREYLFGLFTSENFFEVFATLVTGTSGSHQRVRPEFLLEMDAVVPPKDCIASFSGIARPLYARVTASLSESQTLSSIRDALLPKLVSGEIRVNDPEQRVGVEA